MVAPEMCCKATDQFSDQKFWAKIPNPHKHGPRPALQIPHFCCCLCVKLILAWGSQSGARLASGWWIWPGMGIGFISTPHKMWEGKNLFSDLTQTHGVGVNAAQAVTELSSKSPSGGDVRTFLGSLTHPSLRGTAAMPLPRGSWPGSFGLEATSWSRSRN